MSFRHHRTLGVESFEDRLLPSSFGFHDLSPAAYGPAHAPGPDHPEPAPGPDHAGPFGAYRAGPGGFDPGGGNDTFPGSPPIREVILVFPASDRGGPPQREAPATREVPLPEPLPAPVVEHFEEVGRPIVATPAGLAVVLPVRFAPTPEARQFLGPQLGAQAGAPATDEAVRPAGAHATPAAPLPAGSVYPVSVVSAGTLVPGASVAESADPAGPVVAVPAVPEPGAPPVVDAADPIDVDVPGGLPLAGLLGIDSAALEAQARRLLDRVADIAAGLPDELGGTEGSAWLVSAAVLTGGVGYALWANRSRGRAARVVAGPDSVLARWGEEHDTRLR
jgi:hypothetical protein